MIKTAQTRRPQNQTSATAQPDPSGEVQDFSALEQAGMVEHLTVPGFLRRIPHRWHIDDITRYGDKVGRVTESMQLAYLTTVDRSLGVIRIFPVPLLERVYKIMCAQFGWPQVIDAPPPGLPSNGTNALETLKAHERLHRTLHASISAAEDPNVQHSFAVLMHWLEEDCNRLREELGITNAPAQ